jgi:hypothetical protein
MCCDLDMKNDPDINNCFIPSLDGNKQYLCTNKRGLFYRDPRLNLKGNQPEEISGLANQCTGKKDVLWINRIGKNCMDIKGDPASQYNWLDITGRLKAGDYCNKWCAGTLEGNQGLVPLRP